MGLFGKSEKEKRNEVKDKREIKRDKEILKEAAQGFGDVTRDDYEQDIGAVAEELGERSKRQNKDKSKIKKALGI